jgi:regulatory protein
MDLLARREHSLAELRAKLAARDFDPAEIDTALVGLAREGLADDTRFVDAFIAARIRKGQGPIRIRAELTERGIDAETTARALQDAHDWRALAREVRAKRFGAMPPKEFRERARQSRFLEYRGFTADQVRAAVSAEGDE